MGIEKIIKKIRKIPGDIKLVVIGGLATITLSVPLCLYQYKMGQEIEQEIGPICKWVEVYDAIDIPVRNIWQSKRRGTYFIKPIELNAFRGSSNEIIRGEVFMPGYGGQMISLHRNQVNIIRSKEIDVPKIELKKQEVKRNFLSKEYKPTGFGLFRLYLPEGFRIKDARDQSAPNEVSSHDHH